MYDIHELQLIRASLDVIQIKGSDAKFVSHVQTKTEQLIQELSQNKEETSKKK